MEPSLPVLPSLLPVLAVFALVFGLWTAVVCLRSALGRARARRIEHRLGLDEGGGAQEDRVLTLWTDDGGTTTTVGSSRHRSWIERLDQLRSDAGWETSLGVIALVLGTLSAAIIALSVVRTGSALAGLGVVACVLSLFWFYLKHCVTRRVATFERQLVDALQLASRSLRAGHPLVGAFRLIADEIGHPVGAVFGDICQQQALGSSLEESLQEAAERSSSEDLRLFATSVTIQVRTGGNLAEMMERLAEVIRDRMRLNRRLRVLTAQTQFSKRVLLVLPGLIFMLLSVLSPDYVNVFYTTDAGRGLLALAGFGLAIGGWVMNRMAVLRY